MMTTTSTGPKYPEITVQLTGRDGNAFAIIGAVQSAIKRAYGEGEQFETHVEAQKAAAEFSREAMESESYDALLRYVLATVEVL